MDSKLSVNSSNNYKPGYVEPVQNPDKTTAHIECWNDLRDVKSTESHDKLFQTYNDMLCEEC